MESELKAKCLYQNEEWDIFIFVIIIKKYNNNKKLIKLLIML